MHEQITCLHAYQYRSEGGLLMDETARTEARNYLAAAGFFLVAASFLLPLIPNIGIATFVPPSSTQSLIFGIGLLIVATLLVVLRNRDLIAISFFTMGFLQLFYAFSSSPTWNTVAMGFMLLVALVTLTSRENVKWLVFLIPLIWFIQRIIRTFTEYNAAVLILFFGILTVLSLYYAFACACERFSLPGRKLLTADEQTDFRASGSVLGYMLFALSCAGYTLYYIFGETVLPMETVSAIQTLCSVLLIFVAILLFAVGRMRFTPVMFLLMGVTDILCLYCSGPMFIGTGILFLCIGLFAMLRKESRILPGIMLILLGLVLIIVDTGFTMGLTMLGAVLEGIVALIAIYLSFVVYSQRKLPKF
ncbi:MAG TPA: hypothetical protein O0X27_00975 [Methanocorpusculum sp.]|nr:hypothetical protein [Methanocorpusculum sp.]